MIHNLPHLVITRIINITGYKLKTLTNYVNRTTFRSSKENSLDVVDTLGFVADDLPLRPLVAIFNLKSISKI